MINLVEFLDNVKVLLAKILCVNKLDLPLGLDTKLVNGVGINDFDLASIDYVEFLVLVEKEYDNMMKYYHL